MIVLPVDATGDGTAYADLRRGRGLVRRIGTYPSRDSALRDGRQRTVALYFAGRT